MCGTQGHVKEWLRGKGRNDKKAAVVLLVEEGFGCWGGEEGEEEQAPNINQNKRKNNKAKVFAFKDMVPVVPACCLLLGVVGWCWWCCWLLVFRATTATPPKTLGNYACS